MEQYDASSGQWSAVAAMHYARDSLGACVVAGELYVSGGKDNNEGHLSSVEKFSPSSDTWSTMVPLPETRLDHVAVAVGLAMYVLGGWVDDFQ
jgi:N-acetylneuraminic acid mutarotase